MSQPSIPQGGVHLDKGEGKSFWLLTDLRYIQNQRRGRRTASSRSRSSRQVLDIGSAASHPSPRGRELLHSRRNV